MLRPIQQAANQRTLLLLGCHVLEFYWTPSPTYREEEEDEEDDDMEEE